MPERKFGIARTWAILPHAKMTNVLALRPPGPDQGFYTAISMALTIYPFRWSASAVLAVALSDERPRSGLALMALLDDVELALAPIVADARGTDDEAPASRVVAR